MSDLVVDILNEEAESADTWQAEAAEILARLERPHATKKRNTIIALIDARLSGNSEEQIWKRPDTCSRNIYHEKWKRDPIFVDVLASVEQIARAWQDTTAIRALSKAAERLALASPVAVGRLIEKLNSADEAIVLRAALGILDRAGVETAVKSQTEIGGINGEPVPIAIVQRGIVDALTGDE